MLGAAWLRAAEETSRRCAPCRRPPRAHVARPNPRITPARARTPDRRRPAVARPAEHRAALNMCSFDPRRRVFIAEGWIAVDAEPELRDALAAAARKAGGETTPILNSVPTGLTPPTFIPCGKVTAAFQGLVDTYGVPKYREVNPGVFAVVLFPALFGIMFGDVGHGALLLVFALAMICNEKSIAKRRLDDIGDMCFGGRYILLFNGGVHALLRLLHPFAPFCAFLRTPLCVRSAQLGSGQRRRGLRFWVQPLTLARTAHRAIVHAPDAFCAPLTRHRISRRAHAPPTPPPPPPPPPPRHHQRCGRFTWARYTTSALPCRWTPSARARSPPRPTRPSARTRGASTLSGTTQPTRSDSSIRTR